MMGRKSEVACGPGDRRTRNPTEPVGCVKDMAKRQGYGGVEDRQGVGGTAAYRGGR